METINIDALELIVNEYINEEQLANDIISHIKELMTKNIVITPNDLEEKFNNNMILEGLSNNYISINNFVLDNCETLEYSLKIFNGLYKIINDKHICTEITTELWNFIKNNNLDLYDYIINNKLKEIYNKLHYKLDGINVIDLVKQKNINSYDLVNLKPSKLSDSFNSLNKQSIKELEINMIKTPLNQTTKFKCPKCKKNICSYIEKQIRSADEPMTAFITCNTCNYNWKE